MYYIKCDGYSLYDPLDRELVLSSPTLNLELNKIGSLSFMIYPTHPHFNRIKKMESEISVYQDTKLLFKGRVFNDTVGFYKTKRVEVEGILSYFNDSIIRPYTYTGDVEGYLDFLITQHNEQVDEHQRFKLGRVTVIDSNDYIIRANSNSPKTWSEIDEKLIKLLGGYICIRYETDGNYIDYLEDLTDTSTQSIEYAVNLLDLENTVKSDTLATCIIPYGMTLSDVTGYQSPEDITEAIENTQRKISELNASKEDINDQYKQGKYDKYEDYQNDLKNINNDIVDTETELHSLNNALNQWDYAGGGNKAETRVTIKSVNGGVDYVYDEKAVAKYGKIYEVVTWDDVGEPSNLIVKAREYLRGAIELSNTLTVKAVDLHLTDENIEAFYIGDKIRVYSEPHGINEIMLLTSFSLDFTNPSSFQFTLGKESSSFLDSQITAERDISNNNNRIETIIKDMDTTNGKIERNLQETIQHLNNVIENSETHLRTLLREYRKSSDMEDIRQLVSTSYQQTADEIKITFDRLSSTITEDMEGVYQSFDSISKYIRFIDGDIVLGEVGNDMLTRIKNGRMSFEYNGVEVAYIKDDKLYIKSAEFLDHIKIGRFAFIPRANGNLSFKYLGADEEVS